MAVGRNIKGITVEIGGDTTKLTQALSKVNGEIRNTQAQLKDVNKLLKLDPGNTELITQKHKLLGQAVEETKEKLKQLQDASKQADQALANGSISQEQYDALQREIIETTEELKKLEDQARESGIAVQEIAEKGEKLKEIGGKVTDVGESMTRNLTVPIVAAGAAAIKTASDFDSSMSKVAAVSGATGKEFDALTDKAREMGAKTKFSASEAADAMNYMAMAGWKTEDMLAGIEGVMNLAAASGEDLATTSDIVTDALTAFGLTAKDSGHFADILAAASSNANTNVAMMGETFKYVAPIAGAMGYSAEDTAEMIGLMANAGIKGSQAGTALRKMLTELNGEITFSGEKLGEVTIQTANADGSMRDLGDIISDLRVSFSQLTESEQAAVAETLVGKTAMSGFLAIMNAAPGDIQKLEQAIGTCSETIDGYNGAAEQMAAVMQDNLEGQLTILKSQLQELAISFGEILIPMVRDAVTVIQGFVNWLNGFDDGTRRVIIAVLAVVAAMGPLLVMIGKLMIGIGQLMTYAPKIAAFGAQVTSIIGKLGISFKALGGIGAVLAGVAMAVTNFVDMFRNGFTAVKEILMTVGIALAAVGAVILGAPAAVAGVVAGIVWAVSNLVILIKNHWNEIWEFLTGVWTSIKETAVSVWTGITDTLGGLLNGLAEFFSGIWNGILEVTSAIWETIYNTVSGFVSNIVTGLLNAWNGFISIFQPLIEAFQYLFETIFQAIQILTGRAMDWIGEKISSAWNGIVEFLTPLLEGLKSFFEGIWNGISEFFSHVHEFISGIVSTVWGGIQTFIQTVMDSISGFVQSIWNGIYSFLQGIMNSIYSFVMGIWNDVWNGISSIIDGIVETIRTGFNNAVDFIKGLAGQAFQWGADIINGIINGIKSAIGGLASAVSGVADTIRSYLHFSVPDEGPLTDYESWMPDFMKGLADGIRKSRGLVQDAMKAVSADMVITPQLSTAGAFAGAGSMAENLNSNSSILTPILEAIGQLKGNDSGDIIVPVYIGQDRIDEIVVTASQRANYRSGGR